MFYKLPHLKWFAIMWIYIAFFALIAGAIYFTKNANCLWALLLMPSYSTKSDDKEELD